jgi:hypothetical protein
MRHFYAWTVPIAILALLAAGGVWWFNNNLNPKFIARKCERRVETSVNPDALRSWSTNLLANHKVGQTNFMGPFDAPASLVSIWGASPPSVYIRGGYGGEEPFVFISWGAAAGHWGLSVGSPSFVPSSPTTGSRRWKPGIYFWEQYH